MMSHALDELQRLLLILSASQPKWCAGQSVLMTQSVGDLYPTFSSFTAHL